jgi:hypothetical protein
MVFRTSGTTSGARGEHWRLSTQAYDEGAARHFAAMVLPSGERRRFVKWCFDPAEVADSSLSHMVADLERRFGTGCQPWQLGAEGLRAGALTELASLREPVVVFTTAFALQWLLERLVAPVGLPAGSLLIETGGFKGKSREIPRDELYASAQAALGLPATALVVTAATPALAVGGVVQARALQAVAVGIRLACAVDAGAAAAAYGAASPAAAAATEVLRMRFLAEAPDIRAHTRASGLSARLTDGDRLTASGPVRQA